MKTSSLRELARSFDRTDADDLEARVEAALKVAEALGEQYPEFDKRFDLLVGTNPSHPTAAETVLCEMGLA